MSRGSFCTYLLTGCPSLLVHRVVGSVLPNVVSAHFCCWCCCWWWWWWRQWWRSRVDKAGILGHVGARLDWINVGQICRTRPGRLQIEKPKTIVLRPLDHSNSHQIVVNSYPFLSPLPTPSLSACLSIYLSVCLSVCACWRWTTSWRLTDDLFVAISNHH